MDAQGSLNRCSWLLLLIALAPARIAPRMDAHPPSVAQIVELELRQDNALRQLDELESRIARALLEFSQLRVVSPPQFIAETAGS